MNREGGWLLESVGYIYEPGGLTAIGAGRIHL